jgi:hypothetical protein
MANMQHRHFLVTIHSGQMVFSIMALKLLIGMKQFHFESIFKHYTFLKLIALCCIMFTGCKPLNQTQVAGTYVRTFKGVRDQLTLNTDGTFQQAITYTNGGDWSASGTWKLHVRVVLLDKCYLTYDDLKDVIMRPPQEYYAVSFLVKKKELMRTELQPSWFKIQMDK